MSPERRKYDLVVRRSASEVGYVGLLKSRLGMLKGSKKAFGSNFGKTEDNETQPWAILEKGKRENRRMLDREAEAIWEENRRRNDKQVDV